MEWITSFLLNAMDFLLNILQVSHFCIIFLLNVSLRVISKNANVSLQLNTIHVLKFPILLSCGVVLTDVSLTLIWAKDWQSCNTHARDSAPKGIRFSG